MADEYLLAQGQAKPATEEDLFRDASGITYPNLHRRIDKDLAPRFEYLTLMTAEGDYLLTAEGERILVSVDMNSLAPIVTETLTTNAGEPLTTNDGQLLTYSYHTDPDPSPRKEDYEYILLVQGVNSYRNTQITNIDEDSEIP